MFGKKTKCGVCGLRFTPTKEAVYTAEEPRTVLESLMNPPTRFSAVDCPRCGCQIELAKRAPKIAEQEPEEPEEAEGENREWIIDECDTTDETPSRAWIDFYCPNCGSGFSLEEGQYGWYAPESEIPFKICPICGLSMDDRGGIKDE